MTATNNRVSVRLNDTNADLRITKINNWMNCIQDQVKWKEVAEKAKTFKQ
jgi:hypothetical protein